MNHITLIPNNIRVFADTTDTVGDLINQIRQGQTGGEDVEILEENENGDKKVIPADVKVAADTTDTTDTVGDVINQIRSGQTGDGEKVEILEENKNGDKKIIPADVKVAAGRMTR